MWNLIPSEKESFFVLSLWIENGKQFKKNCNESEKVSNSNDIICFSLKLYLRAMGIVEMNEYMKKLIKKNIASCI